MSRGTIIKLVFPWYIAILINFLLYRHVITNKTISSEDIKTLRTEKTLGGDDIILTKNKDGGIQIAFTDASSRKKREMSIFITLFITVLFQIRK